MQLVYADGGPGRELEVRVGRPDASVADLARAVGSPRPDLCIDGRQTSGATGLAEAGLAAGTTVRPGGCEPASGVRPVVVVRVVGGLDAGASTPLGAGPATVGRDPRATVTVDHPAVSREHCRLDVTPGGQVTVTDLGSSNGTDVNGQRVESSPLGPHDVLSLGGAVLLRVLSASALDPVVVVDPVREVRPGGTIPFTRAPRAAGEAAPEPITAPAKPARQGGPTFSVSALLGPVLLAAGTVVVFRDPRYAAIAALTPLMFLANFVEERTRGRRSLRRGVRDFTMALDGVRRTLERQRAAEVRHRRDALVDPAEALFRAEGPGTQLWERRPDASDFLQLAAGSADLTWTPPLRQERAEDVPSEVAEVLDEVSRLPCVPVPLDLAGGGAVGLRGDRRAALAVARSLLCQAAVTSGPADLEVAVLADEDRAADWDWTKWLPHVVDRRAGGSSRLLAAGDAVEALARELLDARAGAARAEDRDAERQALLLVVVDGDALLEGRPCPARDLLAGRAGPAAGIVITRRLPALCTITMEVQSDGMAEVRRLRVGETVQGVLAGGMDEAAARRCARALARFEDPELRVQGAGLPDRVGLLPLLGLPEVSGAAVRTRWQAGAESLRAPAVLGVSEHDVFAIDLDDDGPHGLIAGTTGSGKSELLRTLVISLALGNDPDHLTLALIDYKGGGALDECARLPHSVGLVTDLDEQLGARALRCLQAELRHREHRLRQVGLSHIRDYQRLRDRERPDLEPMPRLVVVIDEFATLVRALPGFVDSLVGIAQLGRSLGVHLIMATQRPAGSVNEAIKNNVKLRLALRLESGADSLDVIDSPVAAAIGGRQWGRAFYRVSAREVLAVQTALSTGVSGTGAAAAPVSVSPFRFGRFGAAGQVARAPDGPTDLQRLVAAGREAFEQLGMTEPRKPWPEPLPAVVLASELPDEAASGLLSATAGLAVLALADDPDRQTRYPVGWDPAGGNLLLYGAVGAGTSSALASLALGWARRQHPDRLHVYVLDLGAGDLAPLAGLPHTGAHVTSAERERQRRLVRLLRRELESRKAARRPDAPEWLVLVDNLAAFIADNDRDAGGMALIEDLERVYADGPAVGIHFAVTADRAGSVPGAWASLTQQKLLFRLADPGEYSYFDLTREAVPAFVPGRAVVAASGQVVQVVWHGDDLAAAVASASERWPGAARSAPKVGLLPGRVEVEALAGRAMLAADPWWLPVGIGDRSLEPVGLTLYEREHALVAGPPRSGRSTALCALASIVLRDHPAAAVLAYAPRRSPLRDVPAVRLVTDHAELEEAWAELQGRSLLVLVDDSEADSDDDGTIGRLLSAAPAHVHVVAAGRADSLRRAYGHWTQTVRESRCGLLLMPDHDLDGDLLGVTLPRTDRMAALSGRGYLASDGEVEGVQVAVAGGARGIPEASSRAG